MAADPNAYKMQGPDTLGNPMPTQVQPPGSTGSGQTPVAASANGPNQANVATLLGAVGKTTYLSGLFLSIGGATAGANKTVTITGLLSGQLNLDVLVAATAGTSSETVSIQFNPPLAASAPNTPIVVTLPALGAGNITASALAWGFQQ